MKLSDIADNAGSRKKRMRVCRGIGSGKGKQAGRGGKGVSVITGLPLNEAALEELATKLKKTCGAGGAVIAGLLD